MAKMQSYYNDPITISPTLEIRLLPSTVRSKLDQLIGSDEECWKRVFGNIPSSPWVPNDPLPPEDTHYPTKYTAEEIKSIFNSYSSNRCTGFEALLEEWGTSGKVRPTISCLIELLERSKLNILANYIKFDLLKMPPSDTQEVKIENALELINFENSKINETPIHQPFFDNDISEQTRVEQTDDNKFYFTDLPSPHNNNPQSAPVTWEEINPDDNTPFNIPLGDGSVVLHYPYSFIKSITNNFTGVPCNGGKFGILGVGGFGNVYKGYYSDGQQTRTFAVKSMRSSKTVDVFMNEVIFLAKCKHKNILPMEGCSFYNKQRCLLYPLMTNGSVLDRLSLQDGTPPLSIKVRLDIAKGTASGINYLHSFFKDPIVHRDIKSANILLDEDFTPKIGDFGTARLGGEDKFTENVVGTYGYIAAEAYNFEITQSLDVYSFGVILLELLTGQPPSGSGPGSGLLNIYIERECDRLHLLDKKAGDWNQQLAEMLFYLVEESTKEQYERASISSILCDLENLNLK